MGQIGIRSALDTHMSNDLRAALQSQLREYDTIEKEAHTIESMHNWKVPEANPAVRRTADWMIRMRLPRRGNDSKLAAMMIQGNTRGMIKGHRNLRRLACNDQEITSLSKKLIAYEENNIKQMQRFL